MLNGGDATRREKQKKRHRSVSIFSVTVIKAAPLVLVLASCCCDRDYSLKYTRWQGGKASRHCGADCETSEKVIS